MAAFYDDSLQSQLYSQFQSDTTMKNMQDHLSFQQFQQNTQMMQMQQAQMMQMQQSQMVQAQQLAMYGNPGGSLVNMANNQLLGLQSGFGLNQGALSNGLGITPAMQDYMTTRYLSPLKQSAMMQYQHGTSLLKATGSTFFGSPDFGTNSLMRSAASRELATNTVNTGLGVASGVGQLAGGIGGTLALGALATANLPVAAVAAGTYFGGKWALTSDFVKNVTGGSFGGYSKDIFRPIKHVQEELKYSEQLQNYLESDSYRFMSPTAEKSALTQGLTRSGVEGADKAIRGLSNKYRIEDEEVFKILQLSVNNKSLKNVTDVEDLTTHLGDLIEFTKRSAELLGTTSEEIAEMVDSFNRSGVKYENYETKLAQLKGVASILGEDVSIHAKQLAVDTQNMTYGTTWSGEAMANLIEAEQTNAQLILDQPRTTKNKDMQRYIDNLRGAEAAGKHIANIKSALLQSEDWKPFLGAFIKPEGTGFIVDEEAVAKFSTGNYSVQDLYTETIKNIGLWDKPHQITWENTGAGYFIEDSGPRSVNEVMSAVMTAAQSEGAFKGLDTTSILQLWGVNYADANAIKVSMDTWDREGKSTWEGLERAGEESSRSSRKTVRAQEEWDSNRYDSEEVIDNFLTSPFSFLSNKYKNWVEDRKYNKMGIENPNDKTYTLNKATSTSEELYSNVRNIPEYDTFGFAIPSSKAATNVSAVSVGVSEGSSGTGYEELSKAETVTATHRDVLEKYLAMLQSEIDELNDKMSSRTIASKNNNFNMFGFWT